MFGLGIGEIVIVLVVALVLLGPKRLPDAAKQLGKALRDFRRATQDLKDELEEELHKEPSQPRALGPAEPPDSPPVPRAVDPKGRA